MIKKILPVAAVSLVFTACAAQTQPNSPVVVEAKQDQQVLYDQAEKCFRGPRSLTEKGRDKFMECFVTPGRKEAANTCLRKQMQKQGIPLTKARRQKFKTKTFRLLPPGYQARVNDMRVKGIDPEMKQKWQAKVLKYSVPLVLGVAGFGWYVLNFIAYGL